MKKEERLNTEIAESASLIPLECKERVLDIMKAMIFTKNIVAKGDPPPKKTA